MFTLWNIVLSKHYLFRIDWGFTEDLCAGTMHVCVLAVMKQRLVTEDCMSVTDP